MFSKIKNYFRKTKITKRALPILVIFVISLSLFLFNSQAAQAGGISSFFSTLSADQLAAWLIALILIALLAPLGACVLVLTFLLIWVSSYNSFTTTGAVTTGWVVVRDVSNMFFIVVLLIIAIATILGVETYQWKKMLPRLLIMAVLINFSKVIAGILIDFAQVVMMTFVNAFKTGGTGSFVNFIGIDKLLSFNSGSITGTKVDYSVVAVSALLAFVRLIIAGVVIVVMLVVLVMRIVMIWILVVLSPLAFILSTFPAGQKYASQWWEMFGKYLVVGPVLAFFLWLSLATMNGGKTHIIDKSSIPNGEEPPTIGASQGGDWDTAISFIVSIGLLIGGLMITQKMGVAGSELAGSAVQKLQRAGTAPIRGMGTAMNYGLEKASKYSGVELRPQKWAEGFREFRAASRIKTDARVAAKAAQRMEAGKPMRAFMGAPRDAFEKLTTLSGWRAVGNIPRGGGKELQQMFKASQDRRGEIARLELGRISPMDAAKLYSDARKSQPNQEKNRLEKERDRLEPKEQLESRQAELTRRQTELMSGEKPVLAADIPAGLKFDDQTIAKRAEEIRAARQEKDKESDDKILKQAGLDQAPSEIKKRYLDNHDRLAATKDLEEKRITEMASSPKLSNIPLEGRLENARFILTNQSISDRAAELQGKVTPKARSELLEELKLVDRSPEDQQRGLAEHFRQEATKQLSEETTVKQRAIEIEQKIRPAERENILKEAGKDKESPEEQQRFVVDYSLKQARVELAVEAKTKQQSPEDRRKVLEDLGKGKASPEEQNQVLNNYFRETLVQETIKQAAPETKQKLEAVNEELGTVRFDISKREQLEKRIEEQAKIIARLETEEQANKDNPQFWDNKQYVADIKKSVKDLQESLRLGPRNVRQILDELRKRRAQSEDRKEISDSEYRSYLFQLVQDKKIYLNKNQIDEYFKPSKPT